MEETIKRLRDYIKSEKDFKKLEETLIDKMYKQETISDNSMYDGFIIGLIIYTERFVTELILSDKNLGRVLDGTTQKLELIFNWIDNNIDELIKILKENE